MGERLLRDNHSILYYAESNRLGAALNLIHFAFAQFNRATCINRLGLLEELIVEAGETTRKMDREKISKLRPFILDGLIDSIRICICYENLIKALLLTHACLVNVIDVQHSRKFHNDQKKRPLLLKDYLSKYPFRKVESGSTHLIPGLTNKTLSFEILTRKPYMDLIEIPPEFIGIVKEHYAKRNEIHFYIEESFQFGKYQIDELKQLKDYTNTVLIKNNNGIAQALKLGQDKFLNLDMLK